MKRFGSSRPTACPEDGGTGLRAVVAAALHAGPRSGLRAGARGCAAASPDYGAGAFAAVRIQLYPLQ